MMSLRLLRTLLSVLFGPMIRAIVERTRTTVARSPSLGPSGPWARHHVAAIHPPRARAHKPPLRPEIVRAPPHILAILAKAPDVEPEFAALRAPPEATHPSVLPTPTLLPEESAPRVKRRRHRAPKVWAASLALRLSRGCRAVAEWLVFDSPPPASSTFARPA